MSQMTSQGTDQVIDKTTSGTEYYTEERCYITELHNTAGDAGVSVARARVEPNVMTAWHRVNNTAERYLITEGEGIAEIGDTAPINLHAGESVTIPVGVRQRIKNTGDTDLIFLCICTPRFEWDNYESLED